MSISRAKTCDSSSAPRHALVSPHPIRSLNGAALTTAPASSHGRSRKRKAAELQPASSKKSDPVVIDLTQDSPPRKRKAKPPTIDAVNMVEGKEAKENPTKSHGSEEKRLRKWRSHPPASYTQVRDRALTQRMFALDRQRDNSNPDHPTESVTLAGSTGNVYNITVDKVPCCDCPHAKKGNQCKHVAYVLSRILRAPAHLEYQLAFLSSELREIFAQAPPLPSETAAAGDDNNGGRDGNRKPLDGECPICCVDFEPAGIEQVVYCRAACGNNIHKECFRQWAATKGHDSVTCPFCRTPWRGDAESVKDIATTGPRNDEGYVNVAGQLGLSRVRDYSSYHPHWVRRHVRGGRRGWDVDDGVYRGWY